MAKKLKIHSGISVYKPRYAKKNRPVKIKRTFKKGIGTSRLSIPAVNQNPQPPNATPSQLLDQQTTQPDTSTLNNNSTLTNLASSQTPGQTPGITPDVSAFSSYTPETGKPDPRDAQYWQDVTRLYFDKTQKENQLDTEGVYAQTAYEQALADRAREHPRDILASNIQANQAGNLLSSVQQENLGQLEQNYFETNSDAERQFQQEQAVRALTRQALEQGYTVDEAAELAAALDRASQAQLNQAPPYDPNADQYGDTYGTPGSLSDYLDQLFGVSSSIGKSKKKTTTKKTTSKKSALKKSAPIKIKKKKR